MILTSTEGQSDLPRYFARVLVMLQNSTFGRLDLQLEDGRIFRVEGAKPGPAAVLRVHDPDLFTRLIREGDLGFCDAYLDEWWNTPDLQAFMDLIHMGDGTVCDGFPGKKYWPAYFEMIRERLKPGGNATLQVINVGDHRWEAYKRGVDFIQKYIFPGGMLPCPTVLHQQVEQAGLNVVRSVEFGASYTQTLRRWHGAFNRKWDQIASLGFDDRFRRMWNFYLTTCAAAFENAACDVTQITVSRRT